MQVLGPKCQLNIGANNSASKPVDATIEILEWISDFILQGIW